ncbi:Irr1 protein [Saccharomycopsis crataegensis]|uniref:Irr1 protein n=1 Tax=Saccharomycopsis crataegensis TaxID=43959 RepID=A0AAV5QNF5_9ASCO|nr:Irr1 protein [Saccharomycopsis crataegensis]
MPKTAKNPLEDSGRRRSSRVRFSNVNYNEDDSHDEVEDKDKEVVQQNESSSDESESENDKEKDDEYVPSGQHKKKRKDASNSTRPRSNPKKSRGKKQSSKNYYNELEENLVENNIFKSLEDPEVSIVELANDWLEEYQENKDIATKDLINLILRSCGCLSQLETHDVYNIEACSNTVTELEANFQNQVLHEFPFTSKSRNFKHFKNNFLEFFKQTIILSSEKNILIGDPSDAEKDENEGAEEEGSFFENLLIWLSHLSASTIRPLRYVTTNILLSIQTTVCEIYVKVIKNQDKNSNNLNAENEKLAATQKKLKAKRISKAEQQKFNRDLKKHQNHIESIKKNLKLYEFNKSVLGEYLFDLFETVFVFRFKDTDTKIRIECIKSLYTWMDLCPEYFFENTYLKYFGWWLFDEKISVKAEVLKVLTKLYKNSDNSIISGLKQFTERFKKIIISSLLKENDHNIKAQCLNVLIEINKMGFLDDSEILKINNFMFSVLKNDATDVINEFNNVPEIHKQMKNNSKLLNELVKFINIVETERSSDLIEKFKLNISVFEKNNNIGIHEIIKFKSLIKIVNHSKNFKNGTNSEDENENDKDEEFEDGLTSDISTIVKKYSSEHIPNDISSSGFRKFFINGNSKNKDELPPAIYINEIFRLGLLLYKNFPSYFKSWKFLLQYLTTDLSSFNLEDSDNAVSVDSEFKKLLELNESEEFFLLCFLYGVLYGVLSKEPINYYIEDYSEKKKTKMTKKELELKKAAEMEAEELENVKEANAKLAKTNMDDGVAEDDSDHEEQGIDVTFEVGDDGADADDDHDDDINKVESTEKIIGQLINHLPVLIEKFEPSSYNLRVILKIFFDLVIDDERALSTSNNSSESFIIFSKVIKKLLTIFKNISGSNSSANDDISILKIEFEKFFEIVRIAINNDELDSEFKLLIQNLMIELSLELTNVMSSVTSQDTSMTKLNVAKNLIDNVGLVIKKILIVGQSFNISEYLNDALIDEIGDKVISPLAYYNSDDLLYDCDVDVIEISISKNKEKESNSFSKNFELILNLYLNYCSWKLLKLYDFAEDQSSTFINQLDDASQEHNGKPSISKYLGKYQTVIDQLEEFLIGDESARLSQLLFKLKMKAGKYLADLLIALKLFQNTFMNTNKLSDHFDDFDFYLDSQINLDLSIDLKKAFETIFLHLESDMAKYLNVQLDRNDDEDVDFGFIEDVDDNKEASFESDMMQQRIINQETNLISFVLKLLDLRNVKLVDKLFLQRIYLNKKKLGGLYMSVVDSKDNVDISEASTAIEKQERPYESQEKHDEIEKEDQETQLNNSDEDEIDDNKEQIVLKAPRRPPIIQSSGASQSIQSSPDDPIIDDSQNDNNLASSEVGKGKKRCTSEFFKKPNGEDLDDNDYLLLSDTDASAVGSTPKRRKTSSIVSKKSKNSDIGARASISSKLRNSRGVDDNLSDSDVIED